MVGPVTGAGPAALAMAMGLLQPCISAGRNHVKMLSKEARIIYSVDLGYS